MTFLHNIRTVALYEAKTLRRSWFFRLFSLGALVIFTFLNIGLFSPIGEESWDLVSISSSVPLVNLYLLNIAQSIVVIFLASDFLKRDKKLDTNEVLYTRSMSNFEYVIGKTWGILRLFIGLDILILSIGLLMNIISKSMDIKIISYIEYLLIICVPTIVFSLGLAFVLMSLIRNQAITFLILLGIAALNIFYLWFRLGSVFDYMAFGLPVFKSGVIGFDNLNFIINHRLLFLFLGLSLVLATVLMFNRLPQSKLHRSITIILLIAFLTGAGICGINTYTVYSTSVRVKQMVIETNRQYENSLFGSVTDASIEFVHQGESLEASADIKIINDNIEPLHRYLFSLNPSLTVLKVSSGGRDLKFSMTNHIIEIDPGRILNQGEHDSVVIYYQGTINESFCYPNYSDKPNESPYRIKMVNVHKRQAFLTDKYVLLTPESHWYPVAGLNYYPSNPARIKIDFTNYKLRVKKEKDLNVVTQGIRKTDGEYDLFLSDSPLTGLTIAIGNYQSDTLIVDNVRYISYYFPGNDYYKKDLYELKDTLADLVSGIMRDLETNFTVKYPFNTLSLIEVPVHFFSYPRNSTQTRAEVQPSMVLLPEKLSTLNQAGFYKLMARQKRRMERSNQIVTEKELQVRIFNNFIRNTFISGQNFRFINGIPSNEPTRYLLGPSFYLFKNNFYSTEYPVINSVFESHLQKLSFPGPQAGEQARFGTLANNDKANLILKELSLKDLLAKNPTGDTIRNVITVKGDWLFNLLRSKAGIVEFNEWFSGYIEDHSFRRVDISQFNRDVKEAFGFDFYPYLNDWFNSKDQPGFLFTNIQANEIIVGNRSRYQVTFIVSNPEAVPGLFNVSFRTGGAGGGRGGQTAGRGFRPGGGAGNMGFDLAMMGRGMDVSDISKIVLMDPHESKKIGVVLDAQPRAMMINTIFAQNIPGEIIIPVTEITRSNKLTKEFTGEEKLSEMLQITDPSEIIVDNEDSGFSSGTEAVTTPPLKKFLGISNPAEKTYQQVRQMNIPESWQPVVQSSYYGKYILSAVYTRGGNGDRSVIWSAILTEPGYYEIYCYIGKTIDRMMVRMAGQRQGGRGAPGMPGDTREESRYKDMHYKIYHDEGVEEITLDYENAEGGWNNLGRYYLSPDTAKVILTNQSQGRIVIGDAIKWVKQD